MTLVGGTLYVTTASDGCDTAPWRGRIYRVDVSGNTPSFLSTWDVVPGIAAPNGGGGIWGYGGVSVDTATGNVLAATGADSVESYQLYADRLVALDGGLNLLGSYEPFHPVSYPCSGEPCDVDFGATPVVFQPSGCPTLVAAGNKNGNLYLFRENDLAISGAPLQMLPLNPANDWLGSGGVGGVPAYWAAGRMLFVSDVGPGVNGVSGGVVGLKIASDCTLSVAWSQTLGGGTQPDSTPTVAGGVVYVGEGNGGAVHAYDAAIYANNGTHPGTLLAQASVNSPTPGAWRRSLCRRRSAPERPTGSRCSERAPGTSTSVTGPTAHASRRPALRRRSPRCPPAGPPEPGIRTARCRPTEPAER